ncbi:alcohol dehydrogenase catalytic domain-containing protein [Leifsonia poae]|uniref:alcohol dehydrogenase catalytic domain-containing protein n=1 Tax=Leifsonia poae TaxID=110933 RepID=UPI003D66E21F
MKAWVLDEVHGSLRKADVAKPTPGAGQVLVKVKASGLCHSDVGYMEGVIPLAIPLPVILGHEASGIIEVVGEGVEGWNVGDAVASAISGDDSPGVTRDGAYAEYIIVNASKLVRLPDGMDWAQAAAATDAGVTSYTGVIVFGQIKAGDRVGIVGLGGLGMTGARIAVVAGATVYGVEPREALWERANEIGVTEVVADVSELEGRDLDVIVDFAGFGTTTAGAIRAVKFGGRVVLIGLGKAEVTFNSIDLVGRAIDLQGGTPVGDPAHLQAVSDMVAAGDLAVKAEVIDFDAIPDGLARLQRGEVNGRLVASIS